MSPRSSDAPPTTTPRSSRGRLAVFFAAVAAGAFAHRIGAWEVHPAMGTAIHFERAGGGVGLGLAPARRFAPLQQADGARHEEQRAEDRQPEKHLTHRRPPSWFLKTRARAA